MIVCISINLKALKFALSRSKIKKYYSNVIPNLQNMIALCIYICIYDKNKGNICDTYSSQQALLNGTMLMTLRCPLLIVHANKDTTLMTIAYYSFFINPFDINLNLSRIIKEILFAIKTKNFHKELITLVVIFLLPLS